MRGDCPYGESGVAAQSAGAIPALCTNADPIARIGTIKCQEIRR